LRRHEHAAHQISVTVGGRTDIDWWTASDGDRRIQVHEGHILLNPSNEPHAAGWRKSWDCIGFYLDETKTAEMAANLGVAHDIAPVYHGRDEAISGLARSLYHELETDPLACRLYSDTLADFLAMRLLRGPIRNNILRDGLPPLSRPALKRIEAFVDGNIERNISVNDLAEVVDLSPFHFSRRFKVTLGVTPYEYVTRRRVEVSKQLLVGTKLPIADIAGRVGFSTQSHLCLRFRKIVGTTPAKFRQNH